MTSRCRADGIAQNRAPRHQPMALGREQLVLADQIRCTQLAPERDGQLLVEPG
ncbi:MAG: hypothetical protein WDN69_18355 [Aliidongia sp.]